MVRSALPIDDMSSRLIPFYRKDFCWIVCNIPHEARLGSAKTSSHYGKDYGGCQDLDCMNGLLGCLDNLLARG